MKTVVPCLLMALIIIVSSCEPSTEEKAAIEKAVQDSIVAEQKYANQNNASENGGGENNEAKECYIGDVQDNGDCKFTVLNCEESYGKDPYNGEDKKYVTIEMLFENTSNRILACNLLFMSISDDEGYRYELASHVVGTRGTNAHVFVDGEVQPGKKIRGSKSLEVPKSSKNYEMILGLGVPRGIHSIKLCKRPTQ